MRSPRSMLQQTETRSEAYWRVGRRAGEGGGGGVVRSGRRNRRVMCLKPEQKALCGRGELVVWSAVGRNY